MVEEFDGVTWRTIDELAHETGVTVRNIRAYQARGILPPPEVRARTGYYGPEHLARLELVKDLQSEGVKLDTIKKLLDTTGGATEQVLHFIRTVRHLFGEQDRSIVDLAELTERFGTEDREVLRKAQKLGLLRRVDEEHYEEISPRVVAAGQALVGLGIPLDRSLEVATELRRHADGIAKVYVQLFLDEVWKPFEVSGRPEEQWPHIYEVITRLRAVAGEVLVAMLEIAVTERLDVTFGRDIARNVKTRGSG